MKTIAVILLSVTVAGLLGCDPKRNDVPAPAAPFPTSDIQVTTYQDAGGSRLRAVTRDGQVITQGQLLDQDSRTFSSKGFVAYTVYEQGRRLKTFNFRGQELNTGYVMLSPKSKIYISDYLIAFTARDNNGWRLYTFTVDGLPVNTSSQLISRNADIYFDQNRMYVSPDGDEQPAYAVNTQGQIVGADAQDGAHRGHHRRR